MISWMDGFRRCYELPKIWGLVKERMIAFALVILAGIPLTFSTIWWLGQQVRARLLPYIESRIRLLRFPADVDCHPLADRNAHQHRRDRAHLPQRRPAHPALAQRDARRGAGHHSVVRRDHGFGWYLQHYANYSIIYGSLGAAMALLVWMYLISLVILVGAEFNAMLFPRAMLGKELTAINGPKAVSPTSPPLLHSCQAIPLWDNVITSDGGLIESS
jgi:membrane protein